MITGTLSNDDRYSFFVVFYPVQQDVPQCISAVQTLFRHFVRLETFYCKLNIVTSSFFCLSKFVLEVIFFSAYLQF